MSYHIVPFDLCVFIYNNNKLRTDIVLRGNPFFLKKKGDLNLQPPCGVPGNKSLDLANGRMLYEKKI